ncbi:hypothetical protein ACIPLC_07940 [Kitasatospora sp. NPDC086801]|uniref:hypothetical protein n=1 Tax=Kitasatospora sp. NPDC086801 TaxID=3364066 RepID=UPI003803E0D7
MLVGAAFGTVEAITVDVAVAQPIRMSFGDGGFSLREVADSAETGGIMGGAGSGLGAGGRVVSTAAEVSDNASVALAAVGKLAGAADTLPGRMITGAGLTYGYDATFQTGPVMPLDLVLGAVGGAAAPKGGGRRPGEAPDGYLPRTGGSEYIDGAQSERAAQAYERIRSTTGDTERIAANTGISPDVLNRVKEHIFETVHKDVPVPPEGKPMTGRFAPFDHIAEMWAKAESGTLSQEEATNIPYREGRWEEGVNWATEDSYGAHDVAPHESHTDPFVAWPRRGLEKPDFPLADDLSNLDEIAALILAKKKN